MRNRAVIILSVGVFIFSVGELRAAPSNGTRLPPRMKVELGYEYNVLFKRPLDRSYGDLKSQNHFYTASFGALDWLSLDGKIGLGDVTQKDGDHLPKLEYDTGFAGGYGFRVRVFDHKKWGLRAIAGFQHISVHPQDRSINDDKYESFLDDWQISGLIAKDFSRLSPTVNNSRRDPAMNNIKSGIGGKILTLYAGMKGSDCEIVYKLNKHDKKRRFSEQRIGLISGLEAYLFDNKARINVEARFFDETAFSTSVSYLF